MLNCPPTNGRMTRLWQQYLQCVTWVELEQSISRQGSGVQSCITL